MLRSNHITILIDLCTSMCQELKFTNYFHQILLEYTKNSRNLIGIFFLLSRMSSPEMLARTNRKFEHWSVCSESELDVVGGVLRMFDWKKYVVRKRGNGEM